MTEQTSYPLSWPEGWPRTASGQRRDSPFKRGTQFGARYHSMDESRRELANELERLGARKIVLSTNMRLRIDGLPYSNQAQPTDTGAAVYFEIKGKPTSLACDRWRRVEDNIWAIKCKIYNLRADERYGVGSIAQAFRGYMALPAVGESSASDWWRTLGVPINATADQVKAAYRLLASKHHPDRGGDAELFMRVQTAWEKFCQNQEVTHD